MRKQRGFTLIELMIVVAIGLIATVLIGAIVGAAVVSASSGEEDMTIGYNGIVSTRCVGGYKFIVSADGNARQVMDEYGHGVRCGN